MIFKNRRDAGKQLAQRLAKYQDEPDLLVLGLPRGGMPVAAEVARALHAELDMLLVRKLGVPWQRELAVGAIASGGACVFNDGIMRACGLNDSNLQQIIDAESKELQRREQLYRGDRLPVRIRDRHVIVVDDGLATGATMTAALTALRSLHPRQVTAAVPVAAADALQRIGAVADETLCLHTPDNLLSVGQWYQNFDQVEDAEVKQLLKPVNQKP